MIDECPMTEECPGFDRELMACLLRPGDCEFAPVVQEQGRVSVTPEPASADPAAG
jgi:hypothetical protein